MLCEPVRPGPDVPVNPVPAVCCVPVRPLLCVVAPYWLERSLSTRGSSLLRTSELCGPAVVVLCVPYPVPAPGPVWVPATPVVPPTPVLYVDEPYWLDRSLSTRGSALFRRSELCGPAVCEADVL